MEAFQHVEGRRLYLGFFVGRSEQARKPLEPGSRGLGQLHGPETRQAQRHRQGSVGGHLEGLSQRLIHPGIGRRLETAHQSQRRNPLGRRGSRSEDGHRTEGCRCKGRDLSGTGQTGFQPFQKRAPQRRDALQRFQQFQRNPEVAGSRDGLDRHRLGEVLQRRGETGIDNRADLRRRPRQSPQHQTGLARPQRA